MMKSMTGFASVSRDDGQAAIGVTLRSVNHRYLDLQCRLPAALSEMEPRLRALVQRRLSRGRVELGVTVQLRQQPSVEVELNESFAAALMVAIAAARERGLVEGSLSPGDLLRFPQALTVRERAVEADGAFAEQVQQSVEQAVTEALEQLEAMRVREGRHLRTDLDARCDATLAMVERVAAGAEQGRSGVEARLVERVRELTHDLQVDRAAVAQEVVRMAARSDISEEVVRFRAHVAQWRSLTWSPEPCGRKLDFLIQEMNREVNTMGSKADGATVSEVVIALKAELEKMREQVQNVE